MVGSGNLKKKLDTADLLNQQPRFLTAQLTGSIPTNKAKIATARPQLQLLRDEQIPKDPQHFYEDFGLLTHAKTNLPSPKLTQYQYDVSKSGRSRKYRLYQDPKNRPYHFCLMEDFLKAITTCKGRQI